MGKIKHLNKVMNLFEKSEVVNFGDIERIIRDKRNAEGYAKRLINYLANKGKIKRLCKGHYTKKDNSDLAIFCFMPAYFGLQDAMSFHNLWEQETIPLIVTSKRVRNGLRKIFGSNVLIRRIDKKYFFGYEYFQEGNVALPYSDVEKTFIDLIYFKERIGDEAILRFKKEINKEKLNGYLEKYPESLRKRVEKILNNRQ